MGLIPSWAKEINTGYSTINARAETVAEKPAFRSAFQHRRCLIPADGFFEWQEIANSKIKQPWYISLKSQEPMALAGLWEHWQGRDGSEIESCTIIVTAGNELMQPIHDRMLSSYRRKSGILGWIPPKQTSKACKPCLTNTPPKKWSLGL